MSVNTPTLITFVIYIAAMVLIGLAAYRSTNNFSDYILGGRSLGSFVTALSAGACPRATRRARISASRRLTWALASYRAPCAVWTASLAA